MWLTSVVLQELEWPSLKCPELTEDSHRQKWKERLGWFTPHHCLTSPCALVSPLASAGPELNCKEFSSCSKTHSSPWMGKGQLRALWDLSESFGRKFPISAARDIVLLTEGQKMRKNISRLVPSLSLGCSFVGEKKIRSLIFRSAIHFLSRSLSVEKMHYKYF